MSDKEDQKPAAVMEEEDEEEDLEKLQAEIERMEAEAARITKETEELEKLKDSSKPAPSTASQVKRDGYGLYLRDVCCFCGILYHSHLFVPCPDVLSTLVKWTTRQLLRSSWHTLKHVERSNVSLLCVIK